MTPINPELLRRYLSGETSPNEQERVEAWLAEDSERWERLAALREELADAALSEPAMAQAKAEVWARLLEEVREAESSGEVVRAHRSRARSREFAPSSVRPWITRGQLAAALVLAAVGGTGLAMLLLPWRPQSSAEPVRVAATAPGQRAKFRLPDGTAVMLSVASTLRYPATFASGSREVSLVGEAYFEVSHDGRRPFSVQAGDLVARDLGTQFTVRAYPEDAGARVVVREGRVAIRGAAHGSDAPERVVTPGQLGRRGTGGELTVEPADTTAWFAWTEGRLVFANTPLREAVKQLERERDVEIRLSPPEIGNRRFTTSFGGEPTSAILQVIGTGLRLEVVQTGSRSYTLRAK
jgi:ferric-dicitrate binding protein FerR (iron transport regulator)